MSEEKKEEAKQTEVTAFRPLKEGEFYSFGALAKGVKTVEVNQMSEVVGSGQSPEDPKRTVISFWTKDGQLIQSIDPFLQHKEAQKQQAAQAGAAQ